MILTLVMLLYGWLMSGGVTSDVAPSLVTLWSVVPHDPITPLKRIPARTSMAWTHSAARSEHEPAARPAEQRR